jgi:ribose transport system substrate-binding protein
MQDMAHKANGRHRAARIALFAAVTTAALALGGCNKRAHEGAKEMPKIGMSFQEMNNPYFVSMKAALDDATAQLGASVRVADAHHDVNKQIADIQDMIQQGVKILLVNPTDSVGIQSAVKAAHDAGVIVVAIDANASGPVDSFVGSKNKDAGYQSCKYLAQSLGGAGEVAILDGIPVVPILERVAGCKEALAAAPGIKLVDVQNGKQERDVALGVAENMLQAHPNLKGIFSVNDTGAMGALTAIKASNRDIKLTSVDGAPEAISAIKAGGPFIETTAQFPRDQVRIGLAMALARYWGAKAVPAAVPIDVLVVDKKNAGSFSW